MFVLDFSADKGDLEESVIDSDFHARAIIDGSVTKYVETCF